MSSKSIKSIKDIVFLSDAIDREDVLNHIYQECEEFDRSPLSPIDWFYIVAEPAIEKVERSSSSLSLSVLCPNCEDVMRLVYLEMNEDGTYYVIYSCGSCPMNYAGIL